MKRKAPRKPDKKKQRLCAGCGKTFIYGQRLSFEMPALWPEIVATKHACSIECYERWKETNG